jgi:hypothetical protein
VKFFDAVAAEYMVRFRRHQAAGLPEGEAHRRAVVETSERRRAVLEVLKGAGAALDESAGLSLLAAHGWEVAPEVSFPSEAEHERARPMSSPPPDPRCRACGGTTFWIHAAGGPLVCSRCHPAPSPSVVGRTDDPPRGEQTAGVLVPEATDVG